MKGGMSPRSETWAVGDAHGETVDPKETLSFRKQTDALPRPATRQGKKTLSSRDAEEVEKPFRPGGGHRARKHFGKMGQFGESEGRKD